MLILTRRVGETIIIGDDGGVVVTVLGIKGNQVRIGINAPKDVAVHREEIFQRIQQEKNTTTKQEAPVDTSHGGDSSDESGGNARTGSTTAKLAPTTATISVRKKRESKLDKEKISSVKERE